MTVTSTIVIPVDQAALTVKSGATLSAPDKQSFSTLNNLKLSLPVSNRYATFEPNFWILNGDYKFMPAAPILGYMSSSMSDGTTALGTPPVLTITLGSTYSTVNGLTLYFSEFTNDFCDSITIRFYDASNVLINTYSYTPTGPVFATNQAVSNFKKIEIEFISTNKANRWVRLTGIDLDSFVQFDKSTIKDARLVEEINPVSIELPINTVDITLFSEDAAFSITNPTGFYADLQNRAPFDIYELVDGEPIYMGRFYLEDWDAKSENEMILKLIDVIGVLDQIPYPGELVGIPTDTAGTIIPIIINSAGIGSDMVSVDASLTSRRLYGFIPDTTYREALQYMCFCIGAYATCKRSNIIQVLPLEIAADLSEFDYALTSEHKGLNSPVKLRNLVTGIEVVSHHYVQATDTVAEVLFDGDLAIGVHLILFGKPAYSLTHTSSGGLISSGVIHNTYETRTVTTAGHLVITGKPYVDNKKTFSLYNTGLPANTKPNVIRVDEATMAHPDVAADIVQRLYDYYEQRYIQKTKLFASLIAIGDSTLIDTQSNQQIAGIVEHMVTDLARGMIAEVDIIGVVA